MVIRFFASIRNVTNVKEIDWEHSTPTLGELLCLLSDSYGPEFRRWVLEGENLGGSVMVVINGDDARHRAGLATRLAPNRCCVDLSHHGWRLMLEAVSNQRSAFSANRTTHKGSKPENLSSIAVSVSPP